MKLSNFAATRLLFSEIFVLALACRMIAAVSWNCLKPKPEEEINYKDPGR